jgi:MarR family transcriptional regulator, organic hydroperoxide resistance regulator
MSAELLHEYIERISQLLRSETRQVGAEYDLQPIQLSALDFLSHANRYSNTPQGVTEYLGLTKGTVSQTLMALQRKGFIQKSPDKKDGRVVHLSVTKGGRKLLGDTLPAQTVLRALEDVPETKQKQLIEELRRLLQNIQRLNGMKPFGQCRTCLYNLKKSEGKFFCELTQENLSPADIELICREYQLPVEA